MNIANIIKTKRQEKKLSQRQLAKLAGTTQQLIARYETGTEPGFTVAVDILKALDFDFSQLSNISLSDTNLSYYQSLLDQSKYELEYDDQYSLYVLSLKGTACSYTDTKEKFEIRMDEAITKANQKSTSFFKQAFISELDVFMLEYSQDLLEHLIKCIENPKNKDNEALPSLQKTANDLAVFLKTFIVPK